MIYYNRFWIIDNESTKTNTFEDEISELSKEEFEKSPLSLFLDDSFYENEIHYTYENFIPPIVE